MKIFILCKLATAKLKLGHKFSQFIHRFKIEIFWVLDLDCISKCFPILNEMLDCDMFVEETGGSNLWLNCQFSRKRNVHIYITILWQIRCRKYCFQAYMTGKIAKFFCVRQRLTLLRFFPVCNIFQLLINADFF